MKKWFDLRKDKGKFIFKVWVILFLLILLTRLILFIISLRVPIISLFIQNLRIEFFDQTYSPREIISLVLVIAAFKVIDGFIDGIFMTSINILIVSLLLKISETATQAGIWFSYNTISLKLNIDISILLYIFLAGYLWIFLWDIFQIERKTNFLQNNFQKFTRFLGLKRETNQKVETYQNQFKKNKNKTEKTKLKNEDISNRKMWIDKKNDEIIFQEGEKPKIKSWKRVKYQFKDTLKKFYGIDSIGLILFGVGYALFTFYFEERGATYYNETARALFFPLWYILAVAYRSFAHYVRAWIFLFFTILIQIILYEESFIRAEGFFLIGYIILIPKLFLLNLSPYFNSLTGPELINFSFTILSALLTFQFFFLVGFKIYRNLGGYSKLEMKLSNRYIYFRRKNSFNTWDILGNIITAIIWPYNLSKYYTITSEIKYSRETAKESWKFDYGRLSLNKAIKKTKKRKRKKTRFIMSVIVFLILTIILWGEPLSFIFLFLALRQIYIIKNKINISKIKIRFSSRKTEGSLFIIEPHNIIWLHEISPEISNKIPLIHN